MVLNLVFAITYPMSLLGSFSGYNTFFPGRKRLPYGDNPAQDYNLSLYNLNAMFQSHELSAGSKPDFEYRVILVGDSATWGYLLPAQKTLAAELNRITGSLSDGRQLRVYNLGYPVMSLTKDLLILERARLYQPDLVIWLVTLESFPLSKQLFPPLLQHNPHAVESLINTYDLALDLSQTELSVPNFWERTIIGAARELADLFRLQLYGIMWAATGIDHQIPPEYVSRLEDLPAEIDFAGFQEPLLPTASMGWEVLPAGIQAVANSQVMIINEPIFISQGENSDLRYNIYYPRWAYDAYRNQLQELARQEGWHYSDMWQAVPANEFTNTAVHRSPIGEQILRLANLATHFRNSRA